MLIVWVIYVVTYLPLYAVSGGVAGIFALIPVSMAALIYGSRVGFFAGLLSFMFIVVANTQLLELTFSGWFLDGGGN